jgi:hypothetical protein
VVVLANATKAMSVVLAAACWLELREDALRGRQRWPTWSVAVPVRWSFVVDERAVTPVTSVCHSKERGIACDR